jgi:flagellar biogenesis protein FliO
MLRLVRLLPLPLLAALPEAALAQRIGQAAGTSIPWWRVVAALALCLALAVGAAYALKLRMRGATPMFGAGPRRMQLVETLRLSHQVDLCLVRCDGRELMIAATPHGATLVSQAEAAEPVEAPPQ